ncbi:hypothetical protein J1614_009497 [Plenodomus biglobosus]|nr:hypothetical protein J1614_009497 [Plenodomus biglobosus]
MTTHQYRKQKSWNQQWQRAKRDHGQSSNFGATDPEITVDDRSRLSGGKFHGATGIKERRPGKQGAEHGQSGHSTLSTAEGASSEGLE